jgi:hypothetical protein
MSATPTGDGSFQAVDGTWHTVDEAIANRKQAIDLLRARLCSWCKVSLALAGRLPTGQPDPDAHVEGVGFTMSCGMAQTHDLLLTLWGQLGIGNTTTGLDAVERAASAALESYAPLLLGCVPRLQESIGLTPLLDETVRSLTSIANTPVPPRPQRIDGLAVSLTVHEQSAVGRLLREVIVSIEGGEPLPDVMEQITASLWALRLFANAVAFATPGAKIPRLRRKWIAERRSTWAVQRMEIAESIAALPPASRSTVMVLRAIDLTRATEYRLSAC